VTGLRFARRIVVAVIGGTVTLFGVALLVLPGPAFIVIPLGLAILATEFLWARLLLRRAKEIALKMNRKGGRADDERAVDDAPASQQK
jgi:tellurite resistance protein TerC